MSRVALQCYKGRDLDIVTQAESLDSNRALREEYALLTRSVPMLEAVDQVAQDREPNPAMYRMLTGALHTLAATRNPLVTPAFFWKLLSLEGFHPLLDGCARCGEPDGGLAGDTGSITSSSRSISKRAARSAGRARAAVAGRSHPTGSRCCDGCSAAVSTAHWPRRRARLRTRSSTSASARSSIT